MRRARPTAPCRAGLAPRAACGACRHWSRSARSEVGSRGARWAVEKRGVLSAIEGSRGRVTPKDCAHGLRAPSAAACPLAGTPPEPPGRLSLRPMEYRPPRLFLRLATRHHLRHQRLFVARRERRFLPVSCPTGGRGEAAGRGAASGGRAGDGQGARVRRGGAVTPYQARPPPLLPSARSYRESHVAQACLCPATTAALPPSA